jgi:hypothetical protein
VIAGAGPFGRSTLIDAGGALAAPRVRVAPQDLPSVLEKAAMAREAYRPSGTWATRSRRRPPRNLLAVSKFPGRRVTSVLGMTPTLLDGRQPRAVSLTASTAMRCATCGRS